MSKTKEPRKRRYFQKNSKSKTAKTLFIKKGKSPRIKIGKKDGKNGRHVNKSIKLEGDNLIEKLKDCRVRPVCETIFELLCKFERKHKNKKIVRKLTSTIFSAAIKLNEKYKPNLKIRQLKQDDFHHFRNIIILMITPIKIYHPTKIVTYTSPSELLNRIKRKAKEKKK